jgi:hypothetical protein
MILWSVDGSHMPIGRPGGAPFRAAPSRQAPPTGGACPPEPDLGLRPRDPDRTDPPDAPSLPLPAPVELPLRQSA